MNNGKILEKFVQRQYEFLLNMKDEGVKVELNKKIDGKSGATHQIDVYYEFEYGGRVHKVAIECKDHAKPIDKDKVQSFGFKLHDIGNILGEMISANGYQSGAQKIANHYDIQLKTTEDLPSTPHVLAMRLESVALPDETYKAEPFWVIMEHVSGKVTGSYYGNIQDGRKILPLFFSKYHAQLLFDKNGLEIERWCIRGLPRHALRAFILMLDLLKLQHVEPMIVFRAPGDTSELGYVGFVTDRDLLAKEYYCGEIPKVIP